MTLKEAGELLESKEKEWTAQWLAQAGPYEQSLPGQEQARLCQEHVLESARYRADKKIERLQAERKGFVQFHDDVNALWEKCPQYKTLGELMESPEGIELRKRYWSDEANKRGELGV